MSPILETRTLKLKESEYFSLNVVQNEIQSSCFDDSA